MPQKNNPPLPLSFRSDLLKHVLANLQSGECCSLVGISGTGKSNVARFLQRRDVQQAYWNADRIWVISIDSQGLIFNEEQKVEYIVTEMMINRLIEEAESHKIYSVFSQSPQLARPVQIQHCLSGNDPESTGAYATGYSSS